MKQSDEIWSRLTKAARQARDDREIEMPTGFATRVVARGLSSGNLSDSLWERLALRMVGVSCMIALFAVVTHFTFQSTPQTENLTTAFFQMDDAASILLGEESNG
ncbi:MAG: hypothetical protein CMI16_03905 [Opitutaceae bacterium]|nr:hypothetical protein [Opitutaceae bacterium]|tara:strand:- start:5386 stop:5700 length:315 start_codon:yes stop_codon:yes gene_type:complete